MVEILTTLNNILWGPPTMLLLFVVGLLFTVKTGFFQFRKLGYILSQTLGQIFKKVNRSGNTNEGTMTPLQAVSTAISGTVGTGTIAGVAAAIFVGGPGAVFWMWIVAFFGMMTKMVEVSLAVNYRIQRDDGTYVGGPMYYIERGLGANWKPMALFFALMMMCGSMGTAVFVQPHTMSMAMKDIFAIPPYATVIASVVVCGLVIFGGFTSIGRFCEKLTPLMCGIYILASIGCLLYNLESIPTAFGYIFTYAFAPMPAVGGLAGSALSVAIQKGVARGTFSNEAGMGSAPMVHATAKTDHPIRQGMYGSLEVFVSTLIICTMTALVILTSGETIWAGGLNGVELTMAAFSNTYGMLGKYLVGISVLLFALSTMIGFCVEFETSATYLFGTKYLKFFRALYLVPPFLTLGHPTEVIWTVVDISVAILVIPNVIALLLLNKKFVELFKDFETRLMYKK